jgi:hypothetical protein
MIDDVDIDVDVDMKFKFNAFVLIKKEDLRLT